MVKLHVLVFVFLLLCNLTVAEDYDASILEEISTVSLPSTLNESMWLRLVEQQMVLDIVEYCFANGLLPRQQHGARADDRIRLCRKILATIATELVSMPSQAKIHQKGLDKLIAMEEQVLSSIDRTQGSANVGVIAGLRILERQLFRIRERMKAAGGRAEGADLDNRFR